MIEEGTRLDWAMGELLAYATLLHEGVPVRLTGQDSERGTFSHRHAVVTIEDSEEEYVPLAHVREGQARFAVYNSPLSEYGVLGFEYGYALGAPQGLTIWEAQYGDFANGAQVVIDQFLSSAESKWQQMNGLVLLLPHGFEGQGPEHSSARIERFLSLCADGNMQVVNATTPANFFHVLRRQVKLSYRKPLVVFTPKSLLRHSACVSSLSEFATGTRFQALLDDAAADPKAVERLIFCSGKIYYNLLEKRQKDDRRDTAIVRIEQVYPLPERQIRAVLDKYPSAKSRRWVQEEPENMGPWPYLRAQEVTAGFEAVTRAASGSTATGFPARHQEEQQSLVERVFA
jgi:2-oxoglutarate dehydrogenase E1 component